MSKQMYKKSTANVIMLRLNDFTLRLGTPFLYSIVMDVVASVIRKGKEAKMA